jgi:hypothetical protein
MEPKAKTLAYIPLDPIGRYSMGLAKRDHEARVSTQQCLHLVGGRRDRPIEGPEVWLGAATVLIASRTQSEFGWTRTNAIYKWLHCGHVDAVNSCEVATQQGSGPRFG